MELKQLKEKYAELAGKWNGKDNKGEFEAIDANDILEMIESLEIKIKNFEADYNF